jgi:hypothetical protein
MAVNPQPNPNVSSITPPPSNMPNSFPRNYIGYTEYILYETKPIKRGFFVSYIGKVFALVMILFFMPMIVLISGILLTSPNTGLLLILVLLLLAPLVIASFFLILIYFHYRNTYYAITDLRVLILQGTFSKRLFSATYDMITSVEIEKPWILYKLTKLGSITFFVPSIAYGRFVWRFVEDPDKVYKYILDIMNQINLYGSIGKTKRCTYCGKQIKSTSKYCPYCGRRQP